MRTDRPVRFAVIGCGRIGKRHAGIIQDHPDCELVALSDIRNEQELKLTEFNAPFVSNIDELLKKEFDILCVATPNGLHEEHAMRALQAGRHVIVEKPMALSSQACKNILNEAAEHDRQVFCVLQNRFSPVSQWLKELITNQTLGDIYLVQVNCFWNRDERYYKKDSWHGTVQLDGGSLFTQFSHFIDTLYWLFGELENISAELRNFNHPTIEFEDTGCIRFSLNNGAIGNFIFSTAVWDKTYESSLTIIAEKGHVKVGGQYMDEIIDCHVKEHLPLPAPPDDNKILNHQLFFQSVVDHFKTGLAMPAYAEDGMKLVEIIERIYTAARNYNYQV